MVSMTAVACVREHYVLVLVIADPIPAAFRFRQVSCLSAETAPIFENRVERLFFLGHGSSLMMPLSWRPVISIGQTRFLGRQTFHCVRFGSQIHLLFLLTVTLFSLTGTRGS
jgi:hypothetical protein